MHNICISIFFLSYQSIYLSISIHPTHYPSTYLSIYSCYTIFLSIYVHIYLFVLLSAGKTGSKTFGIVHYAGEVLYDAEGFLLKNRDRLLGDIREVVSNPKACGCERTRALFPSLGSGKEGGGRGGGGGKQSLGKTFRRQLQNLMGMSLFLFLSFTFSLFLASPTHLSLFCYFSLSFSFSFG